MDDALIYGRVDLTEFSIRILEYFHFVLVYTACGVTGRGGGGLFQLFMTHQLSLQLKWISLTSHELQLSNKFGIITF